MEISTLVLFIEKGPRKGESFECKPGSLISIGRVVRGNTFAIRDPAISQKHLIVEFQPEFSRWAVTDLATSNGTSINGANISPNAAFHLADGDIIKIGKNSSMSVKISFQYPVPDPRMTRGRRIATATTSLMEIKTNEMEADQEKDEGNDTFQETLCPKPANAKEIFKDDGKRRRLTRDSAKPGFVTRSKSQDEDDSLVSADNSMVNHCEGHTKRMKGVISAGILKNDMAMEPVAEGTRTSATRAIACSDIALKEKNSEKEVGHDKVKGPIKTRRKGMSRLKNVIEHAKIHDSFDPMAEEHRGVRIITEVQHHDCEKIEESVYDGRKKRVHGKKGSKSLKVSWKEDTLEPVAVEGRRRVTRSSTLAISSFAPASKVYEVEGIGVKENTVEKPVNNRGKHRAKGKGGDHSFRTSRKGQTIESAATGDKVEKNLNGTSNEAAAMAFSARVPKDIAAQDLNSAYLKGKEKGKFKVKSNASINGKKLAGSNKEKFEDIEAVTVSGKSNKAEDMHFSDKKGLVFSWSSFSEIRGIPNTTSKYREDRLINCHATPFEDRVERALNRGIAESSSSMET